MPRKDGTGPLGEGAMTGRGLGACVDSNTEFVRGTGFRRGLGRGFRCGSRKGFGFGRYCAVTDEDFLKRQKASLQAQLDHINKQLEDL
ncbi:MAG: DUF5320 domain-containing protein [Tissierellia bacterium]|jgi:hypothetical protein|nr:DUF5320 domain-containing protein [Bacillota bacterium]NLL22938.1 DUF5320 domain-containing protein [Tissierellia bacterium]